MMRRGLFTTLEAFRKDVRRCRRGCRRYRPGTDEKAKKSGLAMLGRRMENETRQAEPLLFGSGSFTLLFIGRLLLVAD